MSERGSQPSKMGFTALKNMLWNNISGLTCSYSIWRMVSDMDKYWCCLSWFCFIYPCTWNYMGWKHWWFQTNTNYQSNMNVPCWIMVSFSLRLELLAIWLSLQSFFMALGGFPVLSCHRLPVWHIPDDFLKIWYFVKNMGVILMIRAKLNGMVIGDEQLKQTWLEKSSKRDFTLHLEMFSWNTCKSLKCSAPKRKKGFHTSIDDFILKSQTAA